MIDIEFHLRGRFPSNLSETDLQEYLDELIDVLGRYGPVVDGYFNEADEDDL